VAAKILSIYLILILHIGAKCAIFLNVTIFMHACLNQLQETFIAAFILFYFILHVWTALLTEMAEIWHQSKLRSLV